MKFQNFIPGTIVGGDNLGTRLWRVKLSTGDSSYLEDVPSIHNGDQYFAGQKVMLGFYSPEMPVIISPGNRIRGQVPQSLFAEERKTTTASAGGNVELWAHFYYRKWWDMGTMSLLTESKTEQMTDTVIYDLLGGAEEGTYESCELQSVRKSAWSSTSSSGWFYDGSPVLSAMSFTGPGFWEGLTSSSPVGFKIGNVVPVSFSGRSYTFTLDLSPCYGQAQASADQEAAAFYAAHGAYYYYSGGLITYSATLWGTVYRVVLTNGQVKWYI